MKRLSSILLALAVACWVCSGIAFAQRGGGGGHGFGGGMEDRGGMGDRGGVSSGDEMGRDMGRSADRGTSSPTGRRSEEKAKNPGALLSQNTKLASRLQSLLPAGTNLQQAASGFKNLGQFIAAVHVSHNLGIPFDTLKAQMIGPPTESLGKAIHTLKPAAPAKSEAKKAHEEAREDIRDNEKSS